MNFWSALYRRKRSVRLQLLVMALVPLMVLLPVLLVMGISRWNNDYNNLLIAKVESELQVAEQYLQRIVGATGTSVEALAASLAIQKAAEDGRLNDFLTSEKDALGLDFLSIVQPTSIDEHMQKWPVVQSALTGTARTAVDLFEADDLLMIDVALAEQAELILIPTEAAVPSDKVAETRGMMIHTAAPVSINGSQRVLVGGILLNRNLDFIDTINTLVYQRKNTAEDPRGTATLFLEDVRISTNVRLFENVRALGTRVSAEVRSAVLDQGQTWLDRAFVVNDWYISGYLPIYDSFDQRIGMLYVGFLEEPFRLVKRDAIAMMWIAFIGVLIVFIPVFLRLAGGIFSPLERMTKTMRRVETGDLTARNNLNRTGGEIAEVSHHLDHLLDQVQERDKQLRDWADGLNVRVEERTAQLQEANQKLETTYKQLVMSEKLASIGEITAGVAHEINNPVAVIQGNVDVVRLTLGEQAEPVKTELDLIDRQIMRIGGIVGKLLQFARPSDYGKFEEYVNLRDVTQDSLGLVDHVYASKDIDVKLEFSDVPDVKIDPSELQQVIINLIINAVQAMDGKGILTIQSHLLERDGKNGVCLTFHDSGPGISEDTINTIFDPFFTTKRAKGTGLGLSISQTIIQTAGGIITADNHPEGGALMSIWLPT
ncbi:MAG: HAMP domain-containing protein [Rhodobacteraceae bacterium]|nr:HAMP domain-containing protein [Paracoccaceae bacterium]NCV66824.1 HAMP domain-containing protein [Paracoccaceae bacterium]NCW04998.1 HAMP domain-containing protein [Paracoccaceae bacterium]NCW59826.1 HAMP domain-containing protein [Paracoccaceae bacterium]NCW65751.1 HAMP domain-containing protein [Paracoccaceae bacterium]